MGALTEAIDTSNSLRARIRAWTILFIIGLVLSGATALPIVCGPQVGRLASTVTGSAVNHRDRSQPPRPLSAWGA
jgi:hypothetical protein